MNWLILSLHYVRDEHCCVCGINHIVACCVCMCVCVCFPRTSAFPGKTVVFDFVSSEATFGIWKMTCLYKKDKKHWGKKREKHNSSGWELGGIDLPLWFKLTLTRPAEYIYAITDGPFWYEQDYFFFFTKDDKAEMKVEGCIRGLITPTLVQFAQ